VVAGLRPRPGDFRLRLSCIFVDGAGGPIAAIRALSAAAELYGCQRHAIENMDRAGIKALPTNLQGAWKSLARRWIESSCSTTSVEALGSLERFNEDFADNKLQPDAVRRLEGALKFNRGACHRGPNIAPCTLYPVPAPPCTVHRTLAHASPCLSQTWRQIFAQDPGQLACLPTGRKWRTPIARCLQI